MNRLFREPLLQFLLLGLGLFLLYGALGNRGSGDDEILIDRGQVQHLIAGFTRLHQRPPNARELDGLVDEAIREEVFYREAKALGLDQNDTIVRRRLMQKLEFVSEDLTPVPEPTVTELQRFLRAHPQKFRVETRYSLRQVFLDPQRRGRHLEDDQQRLLQGLQNTGGTVDASKLGDAFMLEHRFTDIAASDLGRLFGARFEAALRTLPAGKWHGPVPSGYGVHLVIVDRRDDGRAATLEDVHQEVRRDWIHDQRQRANARFYADLRKRYDVTVEPTVEGRGASPLVTAILP